MQIPVTVRQIAQIAYQLPPVEKFELVKLLLDDMEVIISATETQKMPLHSAYGICADLQPGPSAENIAEIRQEMFQGFSF